MSLENTSISTPCFFGKAPAHVIFRGGSRFCNINSTDVRHNYFPPLVRFKIVHPKKLIHRFMHVLCILVCLLHGSIIFPTSSRCSSPCVLDARAEWLLATAIGALRRVSAEGFCSDTSLLRLRGYHHHWRFPKRVALSSSYSPRVIGEGFTYLTALGSVIVGYPHQLFHHCLSLSGCCVAHQPCRGLQSRRGNTERCVGHVGHVVVELLRSEHGCDREMAGGD